MFLSSGLCEVCDAPASLVRLLQDAVDLGVAARYTQGSEASKGDLYFYSVDHDLRDRLDVIGDRCSVIMLSGEYDYLTTPEDGRRTAEAIRGAEFIEMKEIGHFPMSENHPRFAQYLGQALERIEKRTGS